MFIILELVYENEPDFIQYLGYHIKCSNSNESCSVLFHQSKITEKAIELCPSQILKNYVNRCNLLKLIT